MRQIKTFAIDSEEDDADANDWMAKIQEDGGSILSVQFGPSRFALKSTHSGAVFCRGESTYTDIDSLMLLVLYDDGKGLGK